MIKPLHNLLHQLGLDRPHGLQSPPFDLFRRDQAESSRRTDGKTSWRLMERVGMRRELHAVRESLHRSGKWLDVFGYALLSEEWNAHV